MTILLIDNILYGYDDDNGHVHRDNNNNNKNNKQTNKNKWIICKSACIMT